ncbi:hypothetical protein F5X99DRAFT_366633 [Biscogniauxia marginata]|nr:hypothetical protein F5X99DRAFT_366633 [Biscogniauxia marginata]
MNRSDFMKTLKNKTFGDFVAMYRPFWNTGGEMGNWDKEFISLLPNSCKIFASAGAGFDWVDAAGLDVHENEPHVNPELARMRNIEVLSHNAGASLDSHTGFERLGMENIVSFFETGKAITPVNLHFFPSNPASRL